MAKKYLSADGCFVKTIILLFNDAAVCFLIIGRLLLLGSPWNEISTEVLEWSICVAGLSVSTKVLICKKTEDEPVFCPERNEFWKLSRPKVLVVFKRWCKYLILCESCRSHNWPALCGEKLANNNYRLFSN